MKNKFGYAILVILIVFFGLVNVFNENVAAKDKAVWEYKAIPATAANQDYHSDLNKLGAEGWELAAIQPATADGSISYCVFKRQK